MSVATITELWRMSATELADAIRSNQVSSREVVEAHLRRIGEVNPSINAITVLLAEQAAAATIEHLFGQTRRSRKTRLSKRSDRHVVPHEREVGTWSSRFAARQLTTSTPQQAAIDRAREIIRNEVGGEIVIHDRRGFIRDSDTVAPGRDTYPPRDRR
jgi:Uncharacterized protein conserved in bacteria (DUF2188)